MTDLAVCQKGGCSHERHQCATDGKLQLPAPPQTDACLLLRRASCRQAPVTSFQKADGDHYAMRDERFDR